MGGCLSYDLDQPEARRRKLDDCYARNVIKPVPPNVAAHCEYVESRNNYLLYSETFIPMNREPLGIICYCHGYGDSIHWAVRDTAFEWVARGFMFTTMDCKGHGRSDGLWAYVADFNEIGEDYIDAFTRIRDKYPNLKAFLLGESMGGAVAAVVALLDQEHFAGLILACPMLGITDEIRPHQCVEKMLRCSLLRCCPAAPLVPPGVDMMENLCDDPTLAEYLTDDPVLYQNPLRLMTGDAILRICDELEANASQIRLPFLIVHGTSDLITSPEVSRRFYENATSTDKILTLFEGAKHGVMYDFCGEDAQQLVSSWIDSRLGDDVYVNSRVDVVRSTSGKELKVGVSSVNAVDDDDNGLDDEDEGITVLVQSEEDDEDERTPVDIKASLLNAS